MDSPRRKLLRSIALGLPLVVPGAGLVLAPAWTGCGHCEPVAAVAQVELVEVTSGAEEEIRCESVCAERFGRSASDCEVVSRTQVSCTYGEREGRSCGGAGRRADAPAWRARSDASGAEAWLLDTALLEASAVTAFRRTARALTLHGADASLARRACRAAEDERRHTRAVARLAAVRAPVRLVVRTDVREVPSLVSLARENAREGLIGEAWGALEAHAQAARAEDPALAALMAGIARDEARHALFSLDLDAWARRRLPARVATTLDEERAEAQQSLERALAVRGPSPLGLPHGDLASSLVRLLAA